MKLSIVRVEHKDQTGQLIAAALRLSLEGEKCWILASPSGMDRQLCCEVEGGDIDPPPVDAMLDVVNEDDGFDAPYLRIKLGPGVWPL